MKDKYKIIRNLCIKNIGNFVNLERKEQIKNILQVCLLAIMIWNYVICILWEIRFWDIECFTEEENILYFFSNNVFRSYLTMKYVKSSRFFFRR